MNRRKEALAALFYPSRCLYCGERTAVGTECCPVCEEILLQEFSQRKKIERRGRIPDAGLFFAVYPYTALTRQAVFRLKFKDDRSVFRMMAKRMAESLTEELLLESVLPAERFDFCLPVPMYPAQERQRGYNQSLLLAKEIGERLSLPCVKNLLCKGRKTRKQHDLSYEDRRENLLSAFYLTMPGRVGGKRILLIDDVLTSGNTFRQCAAALREAGAAEVCCLVFLSRQ